MRPDSDSPLRWALVGAGVAGRARAEAIRTDPRSRLVSVYRGRYAADLGVPIAASLEEAIDAAQAVAIASPTEAHAEQVSAALARGRHVVVEFPLATDRATAARLFDEARAANRVLHVEHIELLDAPAATLAALVRPSTVSEILLAHEGKAEVGDPKALALRNVARLHRALAVGGPIARLDDVQWQPAQLVATLTLVSGAQLHLRFRSESGLTRRTTLRIRTVTGVWEQRGDQLYRDGTPITLIGRGGLFVHDHRAAMARICDGAAPYVDEARILHVFDVVEALGALRCGPVAQRSDAGPPP